MAHLEPSAKAGLYVNIFNLLALSDKDLVKCTCPDLKCTSPDQADLKCANFEII